MIEDFVDSILLILKVLLALSLTTYTQSHIPQLDFLTVSNSFYAWSYFLILYCGYFFIVSKVISYFYDIDWRTV